jgi:hypothetical protein
MIVIGQLPAASQASYSWDGLFLGAVEYHRPTGIAEVPWLARDNRMSKYSWRQTGNSCRTGAFLRHTIILMLVSKGSIRSEATTVLLRASSCTLGIPIGTSDVTFFANCQPLMQWRCSLTSLWETERRKAWVKAKKGWLGGYITWHPWNLTHRDFMSEQSPLSLK